MIRQCPKGFGKVLGIGHDPIDCVVWLPWETKPAEYADYLNSLHIAEVDQILLSNCGPSMWLKDITFDDDVECYNGGIVGQWTWDNAIAGHKCDKCDTKINPKEAKFTSVNFRSGYTRIVCANCVQNSLPEGEMRNGFIQSRLAAIQEREQQRTTTDEHAESVILLPSPTATQ